ncbi:MAG: dienelactone hydrolase family protein [Chloroflexota bacterium]
MATEGQWPDFLANGGTFAAAIAAAAPHSRSFLASRKSAEDLGQWLAETRTRFLDLLHYTPAPCDPAPEVTARQEYGDFTRETVLLSTAPWSRIPCDVLVPKRPRDGRWPAPAVVALHCHGGVFRWGREKVIAPADGDDDHPSLRRYREALYGGRGYANELAKRGYVVAVIDAFYFGERRLRYRHGEWPEAYRAAEAALEPESEAWLKLLDRAHQEVMPRVAGALFQAGATWPGVFVWDDRRTIDYLQTRPEVDAARIGCVGLSVGGYRSALLAAADERIRAAVTVGWMCGLGDLWPIGRWPHSVGWVHYVPGLFQEMDLPDVAALTCPRALMVMQGRQDRLFPPDGMQRALDYLGATYAKAGVGERFAGRMFDVPHQFNLGMQEEAFAWLGRWV